MTACVGCTEQYIVHEHCTSLICIRVTGFSIHYMDLCTSAEGEREILFSQQSCRGRKVDACHIDLKHIPLFPSDSHRLFAITCTLKLLSRCVLSQLPCRSEDGAEWDGSDLKEPFTATLWVGR